MKKKPGYELQNEDIKLKLIEKELALEYTATDSDFEVYGSDLKESEKIQRKNISYWGDVYRRVKQNKGAVISFWILVVLVFFCIFGPFMSDYSFRQMDSAIGDQWNRAVIMQGHWFGTDVFGRDVWVRLWDGGRISFLIALVTVISEGIFGTIYGGLSGLIGGKLDVVMMRIVEIIMCIPSMLYIILFMMVLGPGITTIMIAMAISTWPMLAIIVRGEVLRIKNYEYVMASEVLGASKGRILMKHLLPNTMGVIIVKLTLDIPGAIFTCAFLSFIGIGVPPPNASLGSLAFTGYTQLYSAPYLFFFPAILISLITLTFNLIGDGLRDALDPKLRH